MVLGDLCERANQSQRGCDPYVGNHWSRTRTCMRLEMLFLYLCIHRKDRHYCPPPTYTGTPHTYIHTCIHMHSYIKMYTGTLIQAHMTMRSLSGPTLFRGQVKKDRMESVLPFQVGQDPVFLPAATPHIVLPPFLDLNPVIHALHLCHQTSSLFL